MRAHARARSRRAPLCRRAGPRDGPAEPERARAHHAQRPPAARDHRRPGHRRDRRHHRGVMRSLLFVPADGGSKLDKALASGADAVIIDLEDSIAPDRKAQARESAAAFVKKVESAAKRPRLLVRVNAIATGLIDADLDAVVPARPDAILLPKAEGGASV